MLVAHIDSGESADVLVLSRTGIDTLAKQGKIAPGSDFTLAGSGVAIAVKAGAAKPDMSTPQALKGALLKAKSIAYSEPSASGVYFAKLLERMGIAEQMKAKTKYPPAGGFSGELLLSRRSGACRAAEARIDACRRYRNRRLSSRRIEHDHGIRRGDHGGKQRCTSGKDADCNVAIARGGGDVPVERSRSALTVTPASLPDSRSAI
jgi:Bacterial extracellular solute-binding protein